MTKNKYLMLFLGIIILITGIVYLSVGKQGVKAATVTKSAEQTRGINTLQTVTLDVPSMHCASCPAMVEKTLSRVPGVKEVSADLETKTAKVVFDREKTNPTTLIDALKKDIGYTSKLHSN